MKNIINVVVLAVVMIMFNVSTYAQKNEQQRMSREQLAEKQANYIAKEMAMDDATSKQFIETFCQFQKEMWKLGSRPKRDTSHLSDKEAEQVMNERFDHSQKILDLRRMYYSKYRDFLTPRQIEKVYELEKRVMNQLSHRSQNKNRNHMNRRR